MSRPRSGRRQSGFTLIEVLVALLVFSVIGFAVTSRIGDVVNQTYSIERRTVAHWVADNHLARMQIAARSSNEVIPTGRTTERVVMGGREWRVEVDVESTAHPWLRRIEVSAFELVDDEPIGPLDQLVGFIGRY